MRCASKAELLAIRTVIAQATAMVTRLEHLTPTRLHVGMEGSVTGDGEIEVTLDVKRKAHRGQHCRAAR